jgi:hypothetical protein
MNEILDKKVSPLQKLIFIHIYFYFEGVAAWRAENPIATVTSVEKVGRSISTPEWVEND